VRSRVSDRAVEERVWYDSDDLDNISIAPDHQRLPERRLPWPHRCRQMLVDDGDAVATAPIGGSDPAPG
jgi:hypothetical protein